jgi:peptide/nickel transport system permease protein
VARAGLALSTALLAMPVFWLGPLLVMALSLRWPWLPVSGFEEWNGLVLPTLAVGLGLTAVVAQTTRAAVAEILGAEYIRTARAKGATELRVLFRHALPAASAPILTVSFLQLGHLLAGAVVTETVFDWPGIGKLAYDAILTRDYPVVQSTVLCVALSYVFLNLATDSLNARLNPETRDAP